MNSHSLNDENHSRRDIPWGCQNPVTVGKSIHFYERNPINNSLLSCSGRSQRIPFLSIFFMFDWFSYTLHEHPEHDTDPTKMVHFYLGI